MNKENDQVTGRCAGCKDVKITSGGGNWTFPGCYHKPYKGKWCAEIKDCPKIIENITAETVLESWRRTANPNEDDEVEMKAYKIIEDALEKQTPKDVQETQEDMEIEKICSVCDRVSGQRWRYCWWCGQKFGATIYRINTGTMRGVGESGTRR